MLTVTALVTAGCSRTQPARVIATGAPTASHRILAADGRADERFGGARWYDTFADPVAATYYATPGQAALSADGTVAVVGAPGAAVHGQPGAGAAYVFTKGPDGWRQAAKLVAQDAAIYDGFGWNVAISGDGRTVVAGAPFVDIDGAEDRGAVYSFRMDKGEWAETAKLLADDSAAYDEFGWSVALARGDRYVAIGATGHTVGDADRSGAAYVFTLDAARGAWRQRATLSAPEPLPRASFGSAVAISADGRVTAVTDASHSNDEGVADGGSLTIFDSDDGWRTTTTRANYIEENRNDDGAVDAYGVGITITDDGSIVAVAAPDVNVGDAFGAGAALLYSTSCGWAQTECNTTTTILPRRPSAHLYFASAVAFDARGRRLFLGTDGAGDKGQGEGEVIELIRGSDGTIDVGRRTTFAAPNKQGGRFGTGVALSASGSTALATAPFLTIGSNTEQGGAYILELAPSRRPR